MAFASAEFIALCQAQLLLLTRAFDATSTVIYVAEQASTAEGLSLVPLVAYPETAHGGAEWATVLAGVAESPSPDPSFFQMGANASQVLGYAQPSSARGLSEPDLTTRPHGSKPRQGAAPNLPAGWPGAETGEAGQSPVSPPLVLPLVHEGVALGVMISTRASSPWSRDERQQAEQVANTLALAWVLDQRGQWLQQQLQQRHLNQTNQSETMHNLLHQFRNPLTALQTFGKLLVKRMSADDPNQPIAEGIVRESRRLQDLAQTFDTAIARGDETLQTAPTAPSVSGLLLPSGAEPTLTAPSEADEDRGEADRQPPPTMGLPAEEHPGLGRLLERMPGSMLAVVTPVLQSAQTLVQDRDLHLIEEIPADLPDVWMDAAALGEVFSNLLDNALKYAPSGALIWVAGGLVQQINGQLFQGIAIGDTGTGIPPVDQPRVFERHFRGVQAKGEIPGTGLGLAIARDLVEAMGGHLDLLSPVQADLWVHLPELAFHQGPGTMFIVWLPTV